jgi:hypothetical protein
MSTCLQQSRIGEERVYACGRPAVAQTGRCSAHIEANADPTTYVVLLAPRLNRSHMLVYVSREELDHYARQPRVVRREGREQPVGFYSIERERLAGLTVYEAVDLLRAEAAVH